MHLDSVVRDIGGVSSLGMLLVLVIKSLAWLVHSAAVAVLASVVHIQFVADGAHGDRRGQYEQWQFPML